MNVERGTFERRIQKGYRLLTMQQAPYTKLPSSVKKQSYADDFVMHISHGHVYSC